jgi:hypothetical protein
MILVWCLTMRCEICGCTMREIISFRSSEVYVCDCCGNACKVL